MRHNQIFRTTQIYVKKNSFTFRQIPKLELQWYLIPPPHTNTHTHKHAGLFFCMTLQECAFLGGYHSKNYCLCKILINVLRLYYNTNLLKKKQLNFKIIYVIISLRLKGKILEIEPVRIILHLIFSNNNLLTPKI